MLFKLGVSGRKRCWLVLIVLWLIPRHVPAEESSIYVERLSDLGVTGGLCVMIGDDATSSITQSIGRTGRFLVQTLHADAQQVSSQRGLLQATGMYGLVSVDQLPISGKLPYTENLVNLMVVRQVMGIDTPAQEISRVLCPRGVVLIANDLLSEVQLRSAGFGEINRVDQGDWLVARKPWKDGMDEWTHSRHSAAGNAVSSDVFVGPPRRVRWVVAAESEVPGLVTAAGRNFYAGALARDSFNGLRLWHRDLVNPDAKGRFALKHLPGSMPTPVAAGNVLFAVTGGQLLALDATTGQTLREYPEAGTPTSLLHDAGVLIVADEGSVRALDAESGQLLWKRAASMPRLLVSGGSSVCLLQGDTRRGETAEAVVLEKASGEPRWSRNDLPWAARVYRCVYHDGMVAYEVSTVNDDGPGNSLHLLSAENGTLVWEQDFLPGMNHTRQARAMFVDDCLWLLHGGRDADKIQQPIKCSALDPNTGEVLVTHDARLAHCFPPVATPRFMFSGEMDLTNLSTGEVDANRITKAACGREAGWVPANGLIYITPKHCVCWPMLRGYAALAPARPVGDLADLPLEQMEFVYETGVQPPAIRPEASDAEWPCYRHDAWRSGSTPSAGPDKLDELWAVDLAGAPVDGPIIADWQENPFVKGPVTSPVVAGGIVCVARPDAHEVVALDSVSGAVRWRFTANGRVDTAPTLHRGLCLFGSKSGWVYCLRAADGELVWKRRAAPVDERIVAYGQLESPWPVPGSVLVIDEVAYFAAGRQSFADGGIFVFAVDPASGGLHWVQRLNTVPQQGFYESSALEFDNFDLLYRENDSVAMSRWTFDRKTGAMSVDRWNPFAKVNTGGGEALIPRGTWSYAPRHQPRIHADSALKPLTVVRDKTVYGCVQGLRSVYRRDFKLDEGETFDTKWMTGWAAGQVFGSGGKPWPSDRLAEKATWRVEMYPNAVADATIDALVLAADRLYLGGSDGKIRVLAGGDGAIIAEQSLSSPVWDGMAVAQERLYVSTADGRLVCLGSEEETSHESP
jgi:outer membrane protein assembly factor BamB